MMEDAVLEAGRRLGESLAGSERFRRLRAAEAVVRNDAAAMNLSREYNEQMRKISDLEAGGKPVEPEDKRRLERLHEQVCANEALQGLARASADYMELMAQVNKLVQDELTRDVSASPGTD